MIKKRWQLKLKIQHQQGLTLLEMVVVIALISIVALASLSLVVDTGELKKQQATEDMWLSIKRAILGDNNVTVTGRREYAGFATDMGRLPHCLRELVRPYACEQSIDNATDLPRFSQDLDSKQWAGWRGPYLSLPGANNFNDAWVNKGLERDDDGSDDTNTAQYFDDVNYGWLFGVGASKGDACETAAVEQRQAATIILQSCSDDGEVSVEGFGVDDDRNFTRDYPYAEVTKDIAGNITDITYIPLVTRHDYQVSLGDNWLATPINIKTATVGSSQVISAGSLQLRLNYPINGEIDDYSAISNPDTAPYLSAAFPDNAIRLADATGTIYNISTNNITIPSAATLSGTLLQIPNAVSDIKLSFTDSSEFELQDCPCELEVSAGSTLSGTTLSSTASIKVNPENIAPLTANLGKYWIEVPQAATVNSATSITLPNGTTLTLSIAALDAVNYFPKIILAANSTVTFSGTLDADLSGGDLVVIDTGGTGAEKYDQLLVPSTSSLPPLSSVITIAQSVPPVPIGLRNVTVICDSSTADPGDLFSGDCTGAGASPIATPHTIAVSPRSYVPIPDAIVWDIQ